MLLVRGLAKAEYLGPLTDLAACNSYSIAPTVYHSVPVSVKASKQKVALTVDILPQRRKVSRYNRKV